MSSLVAYRLGDGSPVTHDSARAIWTVVVREVLEEVSSTSSITYAELARQVQQRSGVYTRMDATEWLPGLLADLGEPQLAARVRNEVSPTTGRAKAATARRPRAEPAPRKRQEAPPTAICPTCFMQLPASGRCDTCA